MPTPNGCYCNFDEWDLLVAILEQDQASFNRLQQLIEAVSSAGGANLQSGSEPILIGSDTVSVTFPVPFASVPDVVASISRPSTENLIEFNIDENSITVNGFTASLGAATGTANYNLKWMANP